MSYMAQAWAAKQHPPAFDADGNPKPGKRNPGAKAVLKELAAYADEQGYCWPSMRALCEGTDMGERTIRDQLVTLVDAGYVRRDKRENSDGGQTSNDYWLLAPPEELSPHPPAEAAGGGGGHRRGGRRSPPGSIEKNYQVNNQLNPPGGESSPPWSAKDYTTIVVTRMREVDFEPNGYQKKSLGGGFSKLVKAEPTTEHAEVMKIINKIIESASAGYFCSVEKATERLNYKKGGEKRGADRQWNVQPTDYDSFVN